MTSTADLVSGATPSMAGRIRWDLLDASLGQAGEIHPERPKISIENNTSRKMKRTARGLFVPPDEAVAVNEFSDRLRPVWEMPNGDEFELGVFMYADVNRLRDYGYEVDLLALEATLCDQLVILDQPLLAGLSFPAGTNFSVMLAEIAAAYQVPDPAIDDTGASSSGPMAWAVGRDSGLEAMIEICRMAGFHDPYYDNSGRLVIRAIPGSAAAAAAFHYGQNGAIRRGTIVESTNVLEAYNVFLAIDSGSTASPVVGRYEIPGDQPHSVANRGFAVVKPVDLQGLSDVGSANDAARGEALATAGAFEPVRFDTIPDPRHDTYDVVTYPTPADVHLELGWVLDCDPGGNMSHDLRKLYA